MIEKEDGTVMPDSENVLDMMRLKSMTDRLRELCDAQEFTGEADEVVFRAVDDLLATGMTPELIKMRLDEWQALNRATTQSQVFEMHCRKASEYLDQPRDA